MRKLMILVLSAALLAGCAAAPADSIANSDAQSAVESTAQSTAGSTAAPAESAAAQDADTSEEQRNVLDQLVDFGADTAGGSLKTAKAAAVLVEYLSGSDLEVDVMNAWVAGLPAEKQELLALNWPGILSEAQAICDDPAGKADELATAGVTTDFSGMVLTAVPDKLVTVNTVLGGKAG